MAVLVMVAWIIGLLSIAVAVILLIYWSVIQPWHIRWGATDEEVHMPLPGDDLVPEPKMGSTRVITIESPTDEVWLWLVQIGQGRGGFYSYDRLENLFGCNIHSADQVIPEFQHLEIGDTIRLAESGGGPFYTVASLEPERVLIIQTGGDDPSDPSYFYGSWVFYLKQIEEGATRLIVRQRLDYNPRPVNSIMWQIVEPINFIMEQKMLRGIKERAERSS